MVDVYVKDRFVAAGEATVSIGERGFRFGDGVFETLAVEGGVPYQWQWHIGRLQRGLQALRIPYDTGALQPLCRELLRRNGVTQGSLRIYVSRGVGGRGYDPGAECVPLLVIETLPRAELPLSGELWLSSWEKPSPRSLPVQFKIAQLHSTLTQMEAREHGCAQALLLDARGMLCEASASNLFWRRGESLFTPALATGALEGSTRAAIMRLSPSPVREIEAPLAELQKADAVCLSNTSLPVMAVHCLQPQGWTWQSDALAESLRRLITDDRVRESAAQRMLWLG